MKAVAIAASVRSKYDNEVLSEDEKQKYKQLMTYFL